MTNQFIQLQSVGKVPAVPASDLKAGDVRMYNFASTSLVVKVIEKSSKTLSVITFSESNGEYYIFDIRKTTLVAVVREDQDVSMHTPKEAYCAKGKNKGMIDVSEYFQVEEENAAPVEASVVVKSDTVAKVTYQLNQEKNGVELFFTEKPDVNTRNMMKANGFKWAGRKQPSKWYAIQSEKTLAIAEQLTGVNDQMITKTESNEAVTNWTAPEIEINDVYDDKYNIPQHIQDREHESNWITRTSKTDHNKEIQETFMHYTTMVNDLVPTLDNPYYEFKVKEALQRFKKEYHALLDKWLDMKGKQPSWIVTGRGGLNTSKYNATMGRINKVMLELAELPKSFENKVNKYKKKAYKEKKEKENFKLKNELVQPLPDLKFKTVIRELDLLGNGNIEEQRCYVHEDYMIANSWGAWRVFSDETGKELHTLKATGTLRDAKEIVRSMIKKNINHVSLEHSL